MVYTFLRIKQHLTMYCGSCFWLCI